MIDTLQLMLTNYDASNADLNVQPATVNTRTGEESGSFPLFKSGKRWIEGRKAYNNNEVARVSLKALPATNELGVQTACFVSCEVPKLVGDSNYHPTDKKGTEAALWRLQHRLGEIGIEADIFQAQVARLDAFRNVVADEPFPCYQPIMSLLKGSRMPQRGYENGFLWENTRQQICVYDKLKKMEHDKLPTEGLPSNTVRFEMRLLKSAKVRETLEVKNARELLEHYDRLTEIYEKTMKRQLFSYSVRDVNAMRSSDVERELSWFKENTGRNYFQHWLVANGCRALSENGGDKLALMAVAKLEGDRSKISRIKKSFAEVKFHTAALNPEGPSKRTSGQLYQELKHKLLAA